MAKPTPNPYTSIAARNIFHLKDPPPAVQFVPPATVRTPPNLILTGIADFSTAKWVLVTRADPGQSPHNYTLAPGEIEGGLQIMDIDANASTVLLRVDGIETVSLRLAPPTNSPPKIQPYPFSTRHGVPRGR
ncbi:MAG TPA: hypothetical protein VJ063_16395 [Verrucomicrobiae bacterium]|nr:hypothetical protein [Verrucomicrobiae bacterium]